jgi:hypothetical protein
MPELIIAYKKLATTAKARSGRSIVALIITDATVTGVKTYTRLQDIKEAYSTTNLALLKMCFEEYGVSKLVVACAEDVENGLALLTTVKFNYLAVPVIEEGDNALIKTFIASKRANKFECQAILADEAAGSEAIINFVSTGIKEGTASTSSTLFTVDLACVFATLDLTKSATYFVFNKVTDVDLVASQDEAVEAGKLFLINDGEKIKLSRAVNSLVTLTGEKKASMKKIKIMKSMDLVNSDLRSIFENNYVGAETNDYNNKMLLVSDINDYLKELIVQGALNGDGINEVKLDVEAQRIFIEEELEVDTSNMTDTQILHYNTDSSVFLTGQLSFADSVEDITLNLYY